MISEKDYKELRRLVTEHSGAELSILEGYHALLSVLEQSEQDIGRARMNNMNIRREMHKLKIYEDIMRSTPGFEQLEHAINLAGERAYMEACRRGLKEDNGDEY